MIPTEPTLSLREGYRKMWAFLFLFVHFTKTVALLTWGILNVIIGQTFSPSRNPTRVPSKSPSRFPTIVPTSPTEVPSFRPSRQPSTVRPSSPTVVPTTTKPYSSHFIVNGVIFPKVYYPCGVCYNGTCPGPPTLSPAVLSTVSPTLSPTISPTVRPTVLPTVRPTVLPTVRPTVLPTSPTVRPTVRPTVLPTLSPTVRPTSVPTSPTKVPTFRPSGQPSTVRPSSPTVVPTTTKPYSAHFIVNGTRATRIENPAGPYGGIIFPKVYYPCGVCYNGTCPDDPESCVIWLHCRHHCDKTTDLSIRDRRNNS
eukprot:gene7666-15693_t